MLEKNEINIVTINDLFGMELKIPDYQRPYRWKKESALTLFNDIYLSYNTDKQKEYRIGTVILHKEKNENESGNIREVYNIVDGQQRITTILILLYCIEKVLNSLEGKNLKEKITNLYYNKLFEINYTELSYESIIDNYKILQSKCNEIKNELDSLLKYLLNKCTFVKIVTDNLQEAFQFFDSQNSRGKDLAPHDLLKAYHLREMKDEKEQDKNELVNKWENINQEELVNLFYSNLFPLIRWFKNKSGLYYSKKDIHFFKGIKQNSTYNYSVYHKAANLYVEKYNKDGMYELLNGNQISQFQLTEPLISGRRFFEYTSYYYELLNKIENQIKLSFDNPEDKLLINGGTGDKYVYNLFLNIILFFVDKFGLKELTKFRTMFFYKWCYSLRLVMQAVYPETINNYALGIHRRINQGINMFEIIAEIKSPSELDTILINRDQLKNNGPKKYKDIEDLIEVINNGEQ